MSEGYQSARVRMQVKAIVLRIITVGTIGVLTHSVQTNSVLLPPIVIVVLYWQNSD